MPTPNLLALLGLAAFECRAKGALPFWMFREVKSGRDIGSWCPHTGSARVGKEMYTGVTREDVAIGLYAAWVATKPVEVRR